MPIRRSNEEKQRIAVSFSKSAFKDSESVSVKFEGHNIKNQIHSGVEENASELSTSVNNGISTSEQLLSRRTVIDGINESTETVKGLLSLGWEALRGMTLRIPGIHASVSQERTFRDLSIGGDDSFALCHYYGESSSEFPEDSPHRPWALIACATDNNPDNLIPQLIASLKSSSTEEQKKAALDIKSLAKNNSENRLKFAKAGAIKPLISLMSSSDPDLQEYAVTAILNLSLCDENKELITSSGAINPLVQALMTGNPTAKENAACALLGLSQSEDNKIEIGRSGAIPLLVNLLEHGGSRGKKDAMTALYTLCSAKENRIQAIHAGIMKLLVAFMADFSSTLLDMSACVVSVLVSVPEARTALVQEGGIPVLVKILWSGSMEQKETVVKVLLHICECSVTCRALVAQEEAIIPLLQLSRSGTTSVEQKAETLIELLRQPRSRNTAAACQTRQSMTL